jgi:hypothetical protein
MSLVSSVHSLNRISLLSSTEPNEHDSEAALSKLLGAFTKGSAHQLMDRGGPDFTQSGLHSPYSTAFSATQSEETPADRASAANYNPQEVRSNNYSNSATPTSEYSVNPASARSSSFPEHIQRQYYPSSNHSGSSGSMAQPPSPSSMPLQDGRTSHHQQIKSDAEVPIDPNIAASSPTYPPQHNGQYSPYPPQQEMSHGYQHPGGPAMYQQPRPDWAGYGGSPAHHNMPGQYQTTGVGTPTSAAPAGGRPGQVRVLIYSHLRVYANERSWVAIHNF